MYLINFFKRTVRKSNIPVFIYLVLNILVIAVILSLGIDLKTGFFHIESDDARKFIPIFDDLFITIGLSEDKLRNFVIVGQYLELKGL